MVLIFGVSSTAYGYAQKGYFFGSDSSAPVVYGNNWPHWMPSDGGLYSGYMAELGTWTNWQGCTLGVAMSWKDIWDVNADEPNNPKEPGVGYYWFMAGPGADPHYNGTQAEAYAWGRAQAERAVYDYYFLQARGGGTATHHIPMIFMDIEGQPMAGYANGWNEKVNHCGQITKKVVINPYVDRADFNGFYDYIHLDTIFHPGVYSFPAFWDETFGNSPAGYIPDTYEWTPVDSTPGTKPTPYRFSQSGYYEPHWFGGVNAAHQMAWQWTQKGGDWDEWNYHAMP